jgi:hypothetical protein
MTKCSYEIGDFITSNFLDCECFTLDYAEVDSDRSEHKDQVHCQQVFQRTFGEPGGVELPTGTRFLARITVYEKEGASLLLVTTPMSQPAPR